MDPTQSPTEDLPPENGFRPETLGPGFVLAGRYRIESAIGRGGFGWVYRASDLEVGETVALKVLRRLPGDEESAAAERMRREIRAARRITHPNVVRVHDLGEVEGWRFLTMEHVVGESLGRILRERGPLPLGESLALFRQIAAGVAAAHRCGVIHCDLKPANVLVESGGRVKVLDFGLARLAEAGASWGGTSRQGTPQYVAPEQLEGRALDVRTDVYALGVVVFEMLTGRLPFEGGTPAETARARLLRAAPDASSLVPSIPAALGSVIRKALELDPRDRHPGVDAFVEAATSAATGAEDDRPTETLPAPGGLAVLVARARRGVVRYTPALMILAAVLLVAPLAVERLWRREPPPAESWLADGVVSVAVSELQTITDDPETRLLAGGLSEAIRSRLAAIEGVRLVSVPAVPGGDDPAGLDRLGVEQWVEGRVGRLGSEIRVMVSVTNVSSRERWLTIERSIPGSTSWERIDEAADAIAATYREALERARARAAAPRKE